MFINFLMGKFPHLRFAYSTDKEMVEHFLSGEVTISVTDVLKYVDEWEKQQCELPSQHKIGDKVKVFLMPEGEENFPGFTAVVTAVHFTRAKVKYDLEIRFAGEYATRIYNIDSVLVSKI